MREVKYGQIIGPQMHRVALCLNGQEIAVGSAENWEQAITWGKETWEKLRTEMGNGAIEAFFCDEAYEMLSAGHNPELRYWL